MEYLQLLLLFVIAMIGVKDSTGGFEVELLHRDSPLSPLFNPTATPGERARSATLRSLARLNRMSSIREASVESIITMAEGEFVMALLIGTPPVTTYAIMDTGSDLSWIQCLPCIKCFSQNTFLFDPKKSSTYNKLQCGSPFCRAMHPTEEDASRINCTSPSVECTYTYNYADSSSTSGVLATETFSFLTVKRGLALQAPHVVFGCGNDNRGLFSGGGAGVIGLGGGPLSLISQLGSRVEKRFSYCMPKSPEISSTFKFGVNASFLGKVVSTPLIKDATHPTYYYLKLEGITVGNKKIASKEVPSGMGNTVIDSGTTLNFLEPVLYPKVVATMRELIALRSVRDPSLFYNVCYQTKSLRQISVPTVIYHFTGADITLRNLNIFTTVGELSCLAIAPSPQDFNIYGNVAQMNFEVEYNLENKTVSFAPAECAWKGAGGRVQSYSLVSSAFCIVLVVFLYLI